MRIRAVEESTPRTSPEAPTASLQVRTANEREWLRRYCRLLCEAGVTLTEDDAWQQYRLFAVYSWAAATSTADMASKWQPLHIGLAGTQRATEVCQQLQSVELLEELLS
ncbi:hypothetical protein [Mycolicibacterium pyrenivorans]|uniref:hypothetical protein n=1 Tax=Mycolicibacterium pyrenivorans TaxID=187102 RepID=UPI0021F39521|nr:hypothetical protein [Mycolicibacterium pyrenivorans]MCV7151053.1 hypothetical protein [Mycolicibacterium pyrenivorans]